MSNRLLKGRYELIEKIGEGGMAIVYKGKDRFLNRYVAIKILRPEFIKDEKFIENFRKESQAAAGLSHPNIVNVYDVGEEGNIHFIVMELIDGKSLSQVIEEEGRLDYKEAISITKQVASALSLAHSNQIIHRDVKPHNILITSSGTAKLADFGIAMAVSKESIAEGKEKIMGSVHYFSPEQARGAYVDERSDIYSLGIVLYEMLTGKVPFDGDNPISIALMHINDEIPPVSKEVAGIPPQLEKIIEKATDKYQTNRYASADEMIEDLDNIDFITKVMGSSVFADKGESKKADDDDAESYYRAIEENRNSEVKKKKKPVNKTKIFIIAAAVVIVIAGVIGFGAMMGWFSGSSDEIKVPDFAGKTLEEAQAEAEELGLKIEEGDEVYSPDQEKGLITSQSPSAGSMVSEGRVITVNISLGKKDGVVPRIIDMDYKAAEEYLQSFGFELGIVKTVTSTKPEGVIVSQSIDAGTTADSGTKIDVEISDGKGKEMVQVPSVVGKDVDTAKSELDKAGFKISGISYEENASYQKNLVIRITDESGKEVSAGSELEEGSNINIIVSKGTETSVTPEPAPEPDDDSGNGDSENGSETTGDNSSQA
ncbi:MAG: Stk1 family PASTA domain-containing Ser/Thr kinase [Anaerovoracaceae bacterium]